MTAPQARPRGEPALRSIAMPADTNPAGDIFGGWLLAQMDLAGGSHAVNVACGRVATVGITAMSFHRPVYVGDQVSCYCTLRQVGVTSLTVHVETWVSRLQADGGLLSLHVTEGDFTFVALQPDGSKRALPAHVRPDDPVRAND